MPKIVKGGPFGLFENPISCKISKLKRDPSETPLENSTEKPKNETYSNSQNASFKPKNL